MSNTPKRVKCFGAAGVVRNGKRRKTKMWTKEKHAEVRFKTNQRGKTFTLIWNGKLKRSPCKICLNPKSEAHHEDYSKPSKIIFLCRKHHKEIQKINKDAINKLVHKFLADRTDESTK